MLKDWLTRSKRHSLAYKFDVVDIGETCPCSEDIILHLSSALIVALGSPQMMRSELKILMDDAADLDLDVIKKYIAEEILPDDKSINTLVGDFGEVLAANILMEFDGFWFPIYKLRFREKKDWSMRLTDLFCVFKKDNVGRPLVCYGEVKTKSDKCDLQLGVKGHDSLVKDDALQHPDVLHFLCRLLWEMGKYEEAEFLSRIRLGKLVYDKRHCLFLIHDQATWKEEILVRLGDYKLDERLSSFSVNVVLITNLRRLIDESYEKTWVAVTEMLNGQG